ncbi:MAG TPA: PfkB family carbohydrate kinase, partial [Candidatus Saccharimonadales bacterium]|nr:PfkB family carbohydrate kinase [Candidatus Saccharimonadales bacterium]
MAEQPDVVSIGDVVTDAFIKLLDDQAVTYQNDQGKWLAMPFGTKLPYDHVEVVEAVGNAANAAVVFARLGLDSSFVTNVGADTHGRDIIKALDKQGVDTRLVRINRG